MFDLLIRFRVTRPARPVTKSSTNSLKIAGDGEPVEQAPSKNTLLKIEEVPKWYDVNPFIISGYRNESNSFLGSLASWTYLHNETCNIYSHLIPAVVSVFAQSFMYEHVRTRYPNLTSFDWSVLSLQLLTATVCLAVSTLYHTLLNHSPSVSHRWLHFDYLGIMTLILGNFISGLHFGFYCDPTLKYTYWSLIFTLASATTALLVSPWFRDPSWRTFRLMSFICTGLSAFAPIGHGTLIWGPEFLSNIGVPYYLLEGLLLIIGCFFWERRAPERYFSGKFDIWGHSHTIWHIFVTLSIGAHIMGLMSALEYAYMRSSCRVALS
ncbi:hypothetical protein DTO212C5_7940 [Paecilomyces variotii]|nr:hypothetical protein DTO212C5_7940 [Paecilomyces variotii]